MEFSSVIYDAKVKNYRIKASRLKKGGDALIEIFDPEGNKVKEVLWPAYKVWNVLAHSDDMVDDIENGLKQAGSNGLGGGCY